MVSEGFGQASASQIVTADEPQGFKAGTVTANGSAKENHIGWAAGGDAEYMLTQWLTVTIRSA